MLIIRTMKGNEIFGLVSYPLKMLFVDSDKALLEI